MIEDKAKNAGINVDACQNSPEKPESSENNVPYEYICLITSEIMQDPVVAADGYSYERAAIETWRKKNDTSPNGKVNSFLTMRELDSTDLIPNLNLKKLITEFNERDNPSASASAGAGAGSESSKKSDPHEYKCPITCELMQDPVVAADGHSYEKEAITRWLATKKSSPLTRKELDNTFLIPNLNLKILITFFSSDACVGLPSDIEILEVIFKKYDSERLTQYIEVTDATTLAFRDQQSGWTPAHLAARYGKTKALEALFIKNPQLLDAKTKYGWTPAHLAAGVGNKETLMALYDKNPQLLEAKTDKGWTPVHLAAEYGHTEILKALFDKNPQLLEVDGWTPAHSAAECGHAETLKALFDKNPQLLEAKTSDGWTPAHVATEFGHVEILEALFDKNPQLLEAKTDKGWTPAHLAARYGHTEILEALFDKNPQLLEAKTNKGWTPAHIAARYDKTEALEALFDKNPQLLEAKTNKGWTPAHIAARYDKTEALEALFDKNPQLLSSESDLAFLSPPGSEIQINHGQQVNQFIREVKVVTSFFKSEQDHAVRQSKKLREKELHRCNEELSHVLHMPLKYSLAGARR